MFDRNGSDCHHRCAPKIQINVSRHREHAQNPGQWRLHDGSEFTMCSSSAQNFQKLNLSKLGQDSRNRSLIMASHGEAQLLDWRFAQTVRV